MLHLVLVALSSGATRVALMPPFGNWVAPNSTTLTLCSGTLALCIGVAGWSICRLIFDEADFTTVVKPLVLAILMGIVAALVVRL